MTPQPHTDPPHTDLPSGGTTARRAARWARRHKVVSVLGGLVLVGALGQLGGSGDTATSPAAERRTVVVAADVLPTATAEPTASATEPPAPVPATPLTVAAPAPVPSPSVAPRPRLVLAPGGVAVPDRQLTPGSLLAASTRSRVCTPGYPATVRRVSAATREQVFTAYRIAFPPPTGAYELDHLIPLELGGGNLPTNLWPQPYHRGPGAADVKDHLENHLHALVCSGQVTLSAAQQAMAGDWWAAAARYDRIAVRRAPAPTRAAAPAPAPTRTTAAPSDSGVVHPGAFCAPAGGTGHTTTGTAMVCGTTPRSPDRARWHRA